MISVWKKMAAFAVLRPKTYSYLTDTSHKNKMMHKKMYHKTKK